MDFDGFGVPQCPTPESIQIPQGFFELLPPEGGLRSAALLFIDDFHVGCALRQTAQEKCCTACTA